MVLETLKEVRNIIDDKITRIEKFEKWVDDEFTLDEKRNFKQLYLESIFEEFLNSHAKEIYIDIDEAISDEARATEIKEEIKSHLCLEELSYVGNVGIESVNYYNDSRRESDCQYSQVYYYLIPFFDEGTGNWYYTEKTLYLPEIVNYVCEFINRRDRKQKELKSNELE